jgi:hypothetical protein
MKIFKEHDTVTALAKYLNVYIDDIYIKGYEQIETCNRLGAIVKFKDREFLISGFTTVNSDSSLDENYLTITEVTL